ncbi:hypothetical protein SAMN05216167_12519 [Spirosoma endophyticum]|uniref:Uncharacterized protein n=1 Tax=Spirosoma endophyticum TaxID=662367 RepID=A0A1I2FB53_9BACT|nr:hypothetical protein SAMN05216167_12519 [Spirosoma endophyticum]
MSRNRKVYVKRQLSLTEVVLATLYFSEKVRLNCLYYRMANITVTLLVRQASKANGLHGLALLTYQLYRTK